MKIRQPVSHDGSGVRILAGSAIGSGFYGVHMARIRFAAFPMTMNDSTGAPITP